MMRLCFHVKSCFAALSIIFLLTSSGKKKDVPARVSISDQRAALEAIYDATGGDGWRRNDGWKQSDNLEDWYGITCNEEGSVVKIRLRSNNLNGELPDVFASFPDCTLIDFENFSEERESDNHLSGRLPQSMTTYIGKTNFRLRRNHFHTTDFYLPNNRIEAACYAFLVYPQRETDFRLFINSENDGRSEVREHRTAYLKHKATKGKGIDIYIVGDGYDAANHSVGGLVDYWYDVTYDAIFNINPMNKLRKYYNVWYVYGHSQERGVGLFDNQRKSLYGYWQREPLKRSACRFSARSIASTIEKAMGEKEFADRTCVMMVVNSANRGMYKGMMYSRRARLNGEKKKLAVAIVPAGNGFRSLVHHEFVGHAIGRLHDEYGDANSPAHEDPEGAKDRLGPNVDYVSDPNQAKWAKFYQDPRYKHEKIGCYQGALSKSNLYRATEKSYMNGGKRRIALFNAPSRAAIYTRTMQNAFDGWTFDYEKFVRFDKRKR